MPTPGTLVCTRTPGPPAQPRSPRGGGFPNALARTALPSATIREVTALWVLRFPSTRRAATRRGSKEWSRMSEAPAAPKSDAQVISAGMVRIYKDMLGRGPTKTRTEISENMVVTVLAESLTKAEETLTAQEFGDRVRELR